LTRFDRRTLAHHRSRMVVVGLLFLMLGAAACSSAPPPPSAVPTQAVPSGLAIAVGTDGFVAGVSRVPFVVFDGGKPAAGFTSAEVDIFPIGAGQSESAWHGEAVGYPDYAIPYWVTYPDFPEAGFWAVVVHLMAADGSSSDGQFAVQVADSTHSPQIGDAPPASHNRTLDTESDIHKLSSDLEPDPELYRMTVAQALESGRPTVVVFATPAYCTSRMCAPVLDSVKAVAADHREDINFIHVEVYKQFQPLVYADEMETWGLTSEPWTFVIDAKGKLVARLGGPLSPEELEQALSGLSGS